MFCKSYLFYQIPLCVLISSNKMFLVLQGDSGGPLVTKQGDRWIQAGIVSFTVDCAKSYFPSVYARVSQYNDWINSHITRNQPGFIDFKSKGTESDRNVSCIPSFTQTTINISEGTTCIIFVKQFDGNTKAVLIHGRKPVLYLDLKSYRSGFGVQNTVYAAVRR